MLKKSLESMVHFLYRRYVSLVKVPKYQHLASHPGFLIRHGSLWSVDIVWDAKQRSIRADGRCVNYKLAKFSVEKREKLGHT